MKEFVPLREDAEKRGKLIKAASDRKAPPDEACKLIGSFGAAEVKMIKYVEANASQMRHPGGGRRTDEERPQEHRSNAAEGLRHRAADGAAEGGGRAQPERSAGLVVGVRKRTPTKKGGSTFDTLNGNVLAR